MKTPLDLVPGMTVTNDELHDYFNVGNSGGMRKSNTHNCLVIICDHSKGLYDDRWGDNGVLHYTGMGAKGPQSFDYAQNKTVFNSKTNGVALYLFERFDGKKPYTFHGICELVAEPYVDQQLDDDKILRDVCIFPLRLKEGTPTEFAESDIEKNIVIKQKVAKKLTDAQLSEIENKQKRKPSSKRNGRTVKAHERDQLVVEYALRRARGVCQLCHQPAPFFKKDHTPYLEVHHVIWLAQGGEDTWDNVVALCPNCHRKMHIVKDKNDMNFLIKQAKKKLL